MPKGDKYLPLQMHLKNDGRETISMTFDQIAKLVGPLPKSASVHRPWWGNHEGNSQAIGWMGANYHAEPNGSARSVTFRKFRR